MTNNEQMSEALKACPVPWRESDVILTTEELRAREDAAFQRGVQRGRFEASRPKDERVSQNCANWKDGICNSCGVQWQGCEVGPDFKCPNFRSKP